MNTINLDLIRNASDYANNGQYLDANLRLQQIGLCERIWRAVLSCFPCGFVNSARTACLRASLLAIMQKIDDPACRVSPRIREIWRQNYSAAGIARGSSSELEWMVDRNLEREEEGYSYLKGLVPAPVRRTLQQLFSRCRCSLQELPLYSRDPVEWPERGRMTAPLMAVLGGKERDCRPAIVIAVVRADAQADDEKAKRLIVLGQHGQGAYYWGDGDHANSWHEFSGANNDIDPQFFGSRGLTYINSGELTESQQENSAKFQTFLETGEGVDNRGVRWRIDDSIANADERI